MTNPQPSIHGNAKETRITRILAVTTKNWGIMRSSRFMQCATLMALTLLLTNGSAASGQARATGVDFEVAGGMVIHTRDISAGSTWLGTSPFLAASVIFQTRSPVALRTRGAVSFPKEHDGQLFAGLAEVLVRVKARPYLELGGGVGARWYQFEGDDCAGLICGTDPTDTGVAGSLTAALGTQLGKVQLGFELTSLISDYRGRAMHDLLLGIRVRL